MPTTDGTWRTDAGRDAARRWAGPQLLVAAAALLAAVALVLAARRATGALVAPLPPLGLVATAVVVAAWSWGVRALWQQWVAAPAARTSATAHLVRWLTSGGVLLLAVACSWPGGRFVDWLVWVPIVVFDLFGRPRPARRNSPGRRTGVMPAAGEAVAAPARCSLPAVDEVEMVASPAPVVPVVEERIVQQLTRVRLAGGGETIRGTLAAQFAPGERLATLHVAFCPPLARFPQIEAEATDDPDVSVKVVQVLTSGVRIDVGRSRAAERDEWVTVEFFAADTDDFE